MIAVAGCNAARRPWSGSSAGRKVGAQRGWSGAGLARQVHSGRCGHLPAERWHLLCGGVADRAWRRCGWRTTGGRLLDRYAPAFTLTDVFCWVLGRSSDPFAVDVGDGFGVGIVNAWRVPTTPLPSHSDLHASLPVSQPAVLAAPAACSTEQIVSAFATRCPPNRCALGWQAN